MRQTARPETPAELVQRLSPRRRDVLELIVKGLTNEEIGGILSISPLTVRAHVTGLLSDLDVTNRTEAAGLFAATQAQPSRVAEVLARPAITALPFRALADDGRTATVAAGLSADILSLFSRWTWFPVVNDVSLAGIRTQAATSREIGTRLGVRFIVDGALAPRGGGWRLTVSIDDVETERCIWTEKYDFPDSELVEVQDNIAEGVVAAAYSVLLSHVSRAVVRSRAIEDLGAWELAHQGMELQRARDQEANAQASRLFTLALEREPTLVLAEFGLGLCWYNQALNQWGRLEAALEGLNGSAQRCIELAPHAAEGYFLLGRSFQTRGDHVGGAEPLKLAIGRNPSFAAAHALLGQMLLTGGRYDEGLVRMKHASRLGPSAFVAGLALAHFLVGENVEALSAAERALFSTPRYPFARLVAIASAYWLGEKPRAAEHANELKRHHPSFVPAVFLKTFGADVEGVARIHRALDSLGLGG